MTVRSGGFPTGRAIGPFCCQSSQACSSPRGDEQRANRVNQAPGPGFVSARASGTCDEWGTRYARGIRARVGPRASSWAANDRAEAEVRGAPAWLPAPAGARCPLLLRAPAGWKQKPEPNLKRRADACRFANGEAWSTDRRDRCPSNVFGRRAGAACDRRRQYGFVTARVWLGQDRRTSQHSDRCRSPSR